MLVIQEEIRFFRSLCPIGNKYRIICYTEIFPNKAVKEYRIKLQHTWKMRKYLDVDKNCN